MRTKASVTLSFLLVCGMMAPLLSGCNAGLAGVLLAILLDDDDSSGRRIPSTVEFQQLRNGRTQPTQAVIQVLMKNERSKPGDLLVEVAPQGGAFQPATLVPPLPAEPKEPGFLERIETSPDGVSHDIGWDAVTDLGSDVLQQATLRLTANGSDPILVDVTIGNDPPAIASVTLTQVETGLVQVDIVLTDSSSDPVDVLLEYALPPEGDDPPAFNPGTTRGPTAGLATSPDGVAHMFEWDSLADLGPFDRLALVRLTPMDRINGIPGKTGEPVVEQIDLDNNGSPEVEILEEEILTDPDRRGGIAVEFIVRDLESNPVDVFLQWTTQDEPFPDLPDALDRSGDAREALLANAGQAEGLRVAELRDELLEGTVEMPAAGVGLSSSEVLATWLASQEQLLGLQGPGVLSGRPVELVPGGGGPARSSFVCGYSPETGVLTVEPPFAPPGSGGDSLRIDLGGAGGPLYLASSPEGVIHRLIWDSGSVAPGGGLYRLRITPFDRVVDEAGKGCIAPTDPIEPGVAAGDRGSADETSGAKETLGPFHDEQPRILELGPLDRPTALASADIDGDGRVDVACSAAFSDSTFSNTALLFLQTAPGAFDLLKLADSRMREPTAIAATELEGGGDSGVDLALACAASRNVLLIFQRPGLDFFTERQVLTSSNLVRPESLAITDFDGDGDPDITVGDSATLEAAVTVFLRDPAAADGYTALLLDDPAGNEPVTGIAPGDIVGDGGVDVAASGPGFFKVYSVSSPGGGGNTAADVERIDVPGSHVTGVVVTDVDGNGRLDLVGCDRTHPSLLIVLQDSTGSFGEPQRVFSSGLRGPEAIITDDFDSNGVPDFVLADPGEPTSFFGGGVHVFLGTPGGRYSSSLLERRLEPDRIPASPLAVLSVDLDGDGTLELIAGNDGSRELAVYPFGAPGTFLKPARVVGAGQGTPEPSSVSAADMNGDGLMDLLSPSLSANAVTWYRQAPSGAFTALQVELPTDGTVGTAQGPLAATAGDLNGDGRADVVTANFDSDTLGVIYQDDGGDFTSGRILSAPGLQGPVSVALADVDGDGRLDIITAGNLSGDLRWFRQKEDGDFEEAGVLKPEPGSGVSMDGPTTVVAEDLDRDGKMDLAVACEISGNVVVYYQATERGQFEAPVSLDTDAGSVPVSVTSADVDGDGLEDIATANRGGSAASIFLQTSRGQFDLTSLPGSPGPSATGISIGDADLDGRADLALSASDEVDSMIWLYVQGGDGQFEDTPTRVLQSSDLAAPVAVLLVDLDRDGNDDIVSANRQTRNVTAFYGER